MKAMKMMVKTNSECERERERILFLYDNRIDSNKCMNNETEMMMEHENEH